MDVGRYFDDFTVGEVIKHWPGRTIRDFDDTWFTLMTMNTNPLHFDEHYASQSEHGRCLVNGTLVFAITVGQIGVLDPDVRLELVGSGAINTHGQFLIEGPVDLFFATKRKQRVLPGKTIPWHVLRRFMVTQRTLQ